VKLRHDLVLVTWDDAGSVDAGWEDESALKSGPLLVYSIGFVAKRTRKEIFLATNVGADAHCHHQFRIPRKTIISTQVIGKRGSEFPGATEAAANG